MLISIDSMHSSEQVTPRGSFQCLIKVHPITEWSENTHTHTNNKKPTKAYQELCKPITDWSETRQIDTNEQLVDEPVAHEKQQGLPQIRCSLPKISNQANNPKGSKRISIVSRIVRKCLGQRKDEEYYLLCLIAHLHSVPGTNQEALTHTVGVKTVSINHSLLYIIGPTFLSNDSHYYSSAVRSYQDQSLSEQ